MRTIHVSRPTLPPPVPGAQRSWWLREALAAEGKVADAPPLSADATADVVIIGGGYTGMWTAWFLAERAPGTRITLIEQDICGGGPSGRNGGFVHGWWEQLPYLARQYGTERALEAARAADEVVDGTAAWCDQHGVDAWFVKSGYLRVNAFPKRPRDWEDELVRLAELGAPGQLIGLTREEVQRVCASTAFGEGLMMPSAASIQPARLARG
ncbi:MAG TPA: FAD-dependent oxidoreductase, partial [Candidatus Limnocylindria bacterium]